MQNAKKKIAVLGIVVMFAVIAGLASAQYPQTPSQQPNQYGSPMQTNKSMNNSNTTSTNGSSMLKNQTMNQTVNQTINRSMNRTTNMSVSRLTTMNLSQEELNETMMKEFFSTHTNQLVNQTNKQFANVSLAFLFKNHIVVITVINHSVNVTNIVQISQINEVMINQILAININKMVNQTNKPLANVSQVFRFRNHTIVINVINESVLRNVTCKRELKIDEPKEGATINKNNVTIVSNYTNFSVIPHFGERNVKGQGHLHYFKDVTAPTTPGQLATTATGTWNQSADFINNWTNLAPGHHKFSVELVNNDHTPLVPPVVATVNVTIQGTNMTNVSTTQVNITRNITTTTSMNKSTTIALSAQNIKFNRTTITVPAGAMVTVKFDNKDSGIPHTFSVYNTSAATQTIFKGQATTGPSNTTYTFKAPSKPGTYFFRCDIHPTVMTGTFIVT
jgi:hypothetical protein